MDIKTLFSSSLARSELTVDREPLLAYVDQLKSQSPGVCVSNEGGWQSHVIRDSPELAPLIEAITGELNELHLALGFKPEYQQRVGDIWINVNGAGDYNKPHLHPGAFFSGVYYLQAEDYAGALELMNPVTEHQYTIPHGVTAKVNHYNNSTEWVTPKPGLLAIFSPWLLHYVQPNHSGYDRISLAFNSYIEPRAD